MRLLCLAWPLVIYHEEVGRGVFRVVRALRAAIFAVLFAGACGACCVAAAGADVRAHRLPSGPEYKPVTTTPEPSDGSRVPINSRWITPVFISAGTVTKNISAMFNTDYNSITNNMHTGRGGAIPLRRPSSISGSAAFFHRATARTSTARSTPTSGLYSATAFRTAIRLFIKAATTARRIGATSKRASPRSKSPLGAFDGPSATRGYTAVSGRAASADRFLGSGERLLPERHLLRRQKPAGDRRRDRRCRPARRPRPSTSCWRRKVLNGGAFTVESEYSRYNRLGGYDANYGKSEGAYGLVRSCFRKRSASANSKCSANTPIAEFTDGVVDRRIHARATARTPPK